MTTRRLCAFAVSTILYIFAGWVGLTMFATGVHAQESKIGKWKLDVAKSQYPGPAPQNGTRHYQDRGCGFVLSTRQGVDAEGKAYFTQYVAKVDGNDYPLAIRGSQTVNSIGFTKVNERSVAYTLKVDGKVTANGTTVVSADAKTLTIVTTPMTGERPTIEVYERER